MERVAIVGVGLHPFGRTPQRSGLEQGVYAVRQALADADLQWRDIDIAFGGSREAGHAAAAVDHLGLTGLPFINVYTGCATGGSALFAAANAVVAGSAKYALALGFDKHGRGAFAPNPGNNGVPMWVAESGLMVTTQFFSLKFQRYLHQHGIADDCLVKTAQKAFYNGSLNPNAWRREALSFETIAQSVMVSDPLRKLMFCSPAEGGAAVILTTESEARKMAGRPVYLDACIVRTRQYGTFEVYDTCIPHGGITSTATHDASIAAFEQAGIGPGDIDVLQLQDTEVGAEIMHMAENGFCEDGEQDALIKAGETGIGGKLPINTDGGCLANGEPIGASGLRQIHELCVQLRGQGGSRQVPGNPKTGYAQVYGAPGLAGVNILSV